MFIHRENAMRRPSTYIILFSTKRSLLKNNFNTRYDQNIYHGASNCTFFKNNFSWSGMPPSTCAADIIISI